MSVEDAGQGLHLLAYEPDPDDKSLRDVLARSIEARDQRIPLMVEKIAERVPALRPKDVLEIAGGAVLGRPQLADALVRCGAATNRRAAFVDYLLPGCPSWPGGPGRLWIVRMVAQRLDAVRMSRRAAG